MENKDKSDIREERVNKVEEGHLVAIHKYLDIIDRAYREVDKVREVYKWLAACLTIIIIAGATITYLNFRDMRSDMRDIVKAETEYMNRKASQEIDLLSTKLQYELERNITDVEEKVQSRIDQEFKTENIRVLVENKAQEYTEKNAHKYIAQKVDDSVKPLTVELKQIEEAANKIEANMRNTEIRINEQNSKLAKQVEEWNERNKLMKLADDAITNGNADSLQELVKNEGTNLHSAAYGEILRVKTAFIGSRIIGDTFTVTGPDGSKKSGNDIKTSQLITILKTDSSWERRARAARLLCDRPEKGVPDALYAACKDKRLEVVKEAINAFSTITRYKSDVLECRYYDEWWSVNKSTVNEKLKPLDSK